MREESGAALSHRELEPRPPKVMRRATVLHVRSTHYDEDKAMLFDALAKAGKPYSRATRSLSSAPWITPAIPCWASITAASSIQGRCHAGDDQAQPVSKADARRQLQSGPMQISAAVVRCTRSLHRPALKLSSS